MIGVITNNEHEVFQREVIAGVRRYADAKQYQLRIQNNLNDVDSFVGVLVIANVLPDDALQTLYHSHKPVSLVSHQVSDTPIPCVMPDNIGGISQLVDYLVVKCNRRRIIFIQGDMNQNDGKERTYAFRRQLMRHNFKLDSVPLLRGDFIPSVAASSMREFLTKGQQFDAVAAADYLMAIAAMDVLREADLHIPQEICIVGFGDGAEAAAANLTTVGVDVEEIGYRAARQLIGQIEGLQIRGATLLSTNIVERDSC